MNKEGLLKEKNSLLALKSNLEKEKKELDLKLAEPEIQQRISIIKHEI